MGSTAPSCSTTTDSAQCEGQAYSNDASYSLHYRSLPQTLSWVRQDGYNNLDASILKNFNFTERTYLQLRFETFNTLNHPNWNTPANDPRNLATFGVITSAAAMRQLQFALKYSF